MTLLWLLIFIYGAGAYAISPEQVLKTAWTDKIYLSYNAIEDIDSQNPLRSVETVVSSEENGISKAEIGLKFQLKSWPEWRAGFTSRPEKNLLRQSSLGWALKNRYQALLLYELNQQKLSQVEKAIKLSEKFLTAKELALKAGRVSAKDYLSVKNDLYKFNKIQNAFIQEKNVLQKRIKTWVPDWSPESSIVIDLITVEDVQKFLEAVTSEDEPLTQKISREEIVQINQELEMIKGKENQWMKAVEVSQVNRDKETGYKIELTLQIPVLGSDIYSKQKQNDLILKRALKQKDLEESGDQLQSLKVQILNLIKLYKKAETIAFLKISDTDSLARLETQIAKHQETIDLIYQQQEITSLYFDYLLESGILNKNPDKNYLQRSFGKIL